MGGAGGSRHDPSGELRPRWGDLVFSTGEGDKLDAIREGRVLTFEVDAVEPAFQAGWSVLAMGTAEMITSPAQIHRIEQLHLAPWAHLRDRVFIRLSADEITGRPPPPSGEITFVRQSSQDRDLEPGHE